MKEMLWPENINRLCDAVRTLEEPHVGAVRFSSHSDSLSVVTHGWTEVRGIKAVPGIGQFAADLNAACAPIIEAYAKSLRQHLANECVKLAEKSLASREAR